MYDTYRDTGNADSNVALLRHVWDGAQSDRDIIVKSSDFASNRSLRWRKRFMDESLEMFAKRPSFAANIFGMAVDLASSLYQRPVSRYQPNAASSAAWEQMLWSRSRVAIAEVDRHALIGGTGLIVVNPPSDGVGFKLFAIPAHRWVGLCDAEDPGKLAAAWIQWSSYADDSSRLKSVTEEWLYVDANIRRRYRGSQVVSETSNPGGVLPLISCANTLSTMTFQGESLGGEDLPTSLAALNGEFEQVLFVANLSRGQLVVYGDSKKVSQTGPISPIELDQDDRAETLRQNADIPGMLQAFQTGINMLSRSWNLPANFFQVLTIQPASSASVLQVSTAEHEQFLRRRQLTTRQWEMDLHQTCAAMAMAIGIELDPDVDVTYPQAPIVLTPAEHLAQVVAELTHSLTSRRGAAIALNPHKPIAQVLSDVARAERERKEDQAAQAVIAGRTNDDASSAGAGERLAGDGTTDTGDAERLGDD